MVYAVKLVPDEDNLVSMDMTVQHNEPQLRIRPVHYQCRLHGSTTVGAVPDGGHGWAYLWFTCASTSREDYQRRQNDWLLPSTTASFNRHQTHCPMQKWKATQSLHVMESMCPKQIKSELVAETHRPV